MGCNLEDSHRNPAGHSDGGGLKDARAHADWLAEVRSAAADQLFVNARIDTFLHGESDPAEPFQPLGTSLFAAFAGDEPGHDDIF